MTGKASTTGRPNQRSRTRQDILRAASLLMRQQRRPTLEDIAEAAMVSRATAYRYFPSLEALLVEASLDMVTPEAATLFSDDSGTASARVERVDAALHDMVAENEAAIRLMLVHSLERGVWGSDDREIPARQNRRVPLIEAALEPLRGQFKPASLDTLTKALAFIIGTEGMIVYKDVLQIDDAEARRVKRWAIKALVEAAKKPDAR